jgi:hypothetical protein
MSRGRSPIVLTLDKEFTCCTTQRCSYSLDGCLGLELGGNSRGCDSGILDPACERDCIVDDPLGDGTHRPGVLTDRSTL